jgi:hypothetical protein
MSPNHAHIPATKSRTDSNPSLSLGVIYLSVEPAGTHQSRVQLVNPVGGANEDNTLGDIEAIQLGQQLIKGHLALLHPGVDGPSFAVPPSSCTPASRNSASVNTLGVSSFSGHHSHGLSIQVYLGVSRWESFISLIRIPATRFPLDHSFSAASFLPQSGVPLQQSAVHSCVLDAGFTHATCSNILGKLASPTTNAANKSALPALNGFLYFWEV